MDTEFMLALAGLTALIVTTGYVLWQRHQKTHYRALYVAEAGLRQSELSRIDALTAAMTDAEARKAAEVQLAESQRMLLTLLDNLQGMAYRCRNDADRSMEFVSDGALALTGYRPDQLQGNRDASYGGLIHPDDRSMVWEAVQEALENHGPFQLTYRIRTADGREKRAWEQGVGVTDGNGRLLALEGFISDVSDQVRAEQERQKLQSELAQAQKMESVGRLAGGVAHDFNNMLSVILGHAELALADLDPSDPLRAELLEIQTAGRRSADLTGQLLAFARRQTVAPRVLDLNDTVSGMLKMLRRLIGEDIDLLWMPGSEVWPIKIDPVQVDQVLANLAVNARDAITGVGKVTIETANAVMDENFCCEHPGAHPGNYVRLAVIDDGCGMTPDVREHVFEPFFTTKGAGKGTGLGLATVYGIVKQNDGFIDVTSELDRGTTIAVYLPRATAAVVRTDTPAAPVTARGHGETVLFVEDEPSALRLGQQMLRRLGYTVLAASSPGEAIEVAESHEGRIHLLITDVVMPGMHGHELARRLAIQRPGLKCLFVSGYTADVIATRGVPDSGALFLRKPFSLDALAAKVRDAAEGAPAP